MVDSHDPQIWQELLTRFRDGHAEHGQSLFGLEALSDEEELALSKDNRRSLIGLVGSITLPLGFWWVRSVAGGKIDWPDKEMYKKILGLAKSASECFEPLAARAGSHLPPTIRQMLPHDPPDGQSWWVNMLWWSQEHNQAEYNTQRNRRLVSVSPFDDSARMIEVCGLAGDSPAFPFCVSFSVDGEVIVEVNESPKASTVDDELEDLKWSLPIPKGDIGKALGIKATALRNRLVNITEHPKKPTDGCIRYRGKKRARIIECVIDDFSDAAREKLNKYLPPKPPITTDSEPQPEPG